MSLAADQLWEFDILTFKNVMDRRKEMMPSPVASPVASPARSPQYRGSGDELSSLRAEISELKELLEFERANTRNFHNTMIASLNEMAGDICKLDSKGGKTEFCRVLNNEYSKLMKSRAEGQVSYRGSDSESSESDFSADETDNFF